MVYTCILLALFFHMVFIRAVTLHDNSIIDIAWGCGFILISACLAYISPPHTVAYISYSIILIWGLRLSIYLYLRKRHHAEDPRYAAWRKTWGEHVVYMSYIKVFIPQYCCMLIIALPIFMVSQAHHPMNVWSILWAVCALSAIILEGISDYQMMQFKKKNTDPQAVMQSGLWRYSQHPNYFAETLFWYAMAALSFSVNPNYGVFLSPFTIHYLLCHVSGIPLLEKKYRDNPQYIAYSEKTSRFIMRPPRH